MPVNWKDPNAFTRLLAAMVAAQDMKLDYRKIASMYGQGATYDAIEGRFRIIKKDAAALKAELDSGERPEAPAPARGTPKKTKTTPSKNKDRTVASGRVAKAKGATTPSKKRGGGGGVGVKEEEEVFGGFSAFLDVPNIDDDPVSQAAMVAGGDNELDLYYEDESGLVDGEGMDIEAF